MNNQVMADFLNSLEVLPSSVPWSPKVASMYAKLFRPMPDAVAMMVTAYIIMECGCKGNEFRPVPAQIIEIRRRIEHGEDQDVSAALIEVHKAHKTWGRTPVLDCFVQPWTWNYALFDIKTHSPCRKKCGDAYPRYKEGMPPFTDPNIIQVVEAMGGWPALCDIMESSTQNFWGKQFTSMYAAAKSGTGDTTMRAMRLAYREAVLALPSRSGAIMSDIPITGLQDALSSMLECTVSTPGSFSERFTGFARPMPPVMAKQIDMEANDGYDIGT